MTVSPFLLKMVKQSVLQRERGTEMVNPLCGLEPRVRRGMSGKDPLLACLSLNQVPKRPRNGQVSKPTKNDSRFLLSFVCRCAAFSTNQADYLTAERTA